MAIKEDTQTVQQIIGALQYDKVRMVEVKFSTSEKSYYYKTVDTSINTGDYVVIDSPFSGLVVLQAQAVATPKEFEVSNQLLGSCKWIVQKVTFTEYLQNKVNEEQVYKDLLKSIEAKRAQDVLEYARQTFGAGVNAVLDGYVGSLTVAPVLEAPKKVIKRSSKSTKIKES